jgi:hypothetical protein
VSERGFLGGLSEQVCLELSNCTARYIGLGNCMGVLADGTALLDFIFPVQIIAFGISLLLFFRVRDQKIRVSYAGLRRQRR